MLVLLLIEERRDRMKKGREGGKWAQYLESGECECRESKSRTTCLALRRRDLKSKEKRRVQQKKVRTKTRQTHGLDEQSAKCEHVKGSYQGLVFGILVCLSLVIQKQNWFLSSHWNRWGTHTHAEQNGEKSGQRTNQSCEKAARGRECESMQCVMATWNREKKVRTIKTMSMEPQQKSNTQRKTEAADRRVETSVKCEECTRKIESEGAHRWSPKALVRTMVMGLGD